MKMSEAALKSVVLRVVGKQAADLIEAQEVAKEMLRQFDKSPEEADRIVFEVLSDINNEYRKEIADKGLGPKVVVEMMKI